MGAAAMGADDAMLERYVPDGVYRRLCQLPYAKGPGHR
jgi:hypothetical protein